MRTRKAKKRILLIKRKREVSHVMLSTDHVIFHQSPVSKLNTVLIVTKKMMLMLYNKADLMTRTLEPKKKPQL